MQTDKLELNGATYPVRIHYEHRRNTRAYIGRNAITIRVPSFLTGEERLRQLTKMKAWAKKKLEANPAKFKPKAHKEYKDGDLVTLSCEEYRLKICLNDRKTGSARVISNSIHLIIPSKLTKKTLNKTISILISRCIGSKYSLKLKEKIHELNKRYFKQQINNIRFKHNNSNWGSCSRSGNINISTRLLFAPEDVLEYVCIHELAHLIECNHSKRFWSLVESAMPDYREKREWLKKYGHTCVF